VTLPAEPLRRGDKPTGKLRVGIVAHEMAHLLAVQKGRTGHGPLFVQAIDEILAFLDKEMRTLLLDPPATPMYLSVVLNTEKPPTEVFGQ